MGYNFILKSDWIYFVIWVVGNIFIWTRQILYILFCSCFDKIKSKLDTEAKINGKTSKQNAKFKNLKSGRVRNSIQRSHWN